MRLVLKPVTAEDVERSARFFRPEEGHLLAPIIPMCWPANEKDVEVLEARSKWSAEQQRDIFLNDPHARFIQVVDEDANGDMVCLGRWHEFPNGNVQIGDLELAGLKDINDPNTWPTVFDRKTYSTALLSLFEARKDWTLPGPCWLLMTIATREPYRRKGAAGLILDWGVAKAREAGVPAYLESVPTAKSTYEKHGFREVGRQTFDIGGHPLEVSRMEA